MMKSSLSRITKLFHGSVLDKIDRKGFLHSESKSVLVYGGNGSLGQALIQTFKRANFKTICVDYKENISAAVNIVLDQHSTPTQSLTKISTHLSERHLKLGAIFNVAGGWTGDRLDSEVLFSEADRIWNMNVMSSLVASQVGGRHLVDGGLLVLTGSAPCLNPTPSMITYGLTKAAIHHLTYSLAAIAQHSTSSSSSLPRLLPPNCTVAAILPITLNTEGNRAGMPNGDYGNWTPLEVVSNVGLNWYRSLQSADLPKSTNEPKKPANDECDSLPITNTVVTDVQDSISYLSQHRAPINGAFYLFKTNKGLTKIITLRSDSYLQTTM